MIRHIMSFRSELPPLESQLTIAEYPTGCVEDTDQVFSSSDVYVPVLDGVMGSFGLATREITGKSITGMCVATCAR